MMHRLCPIVDLETDQLLAGSPEQASYDMLLEQIPRYEQARRQLALVARAMRVEVTTRQAQAQRAGVPVTQLDEYRRRRGREAHAP